jgi:hypothetical protein
MIADPGKTEGELRLALHGPGGVARQHVNRAGLQLLKAVLRREADELHLGGIAQRSSGERLAIVHVKPGPGTIGLLFGEALQTRVDAAEQLATRLHIVKR